MLNFLKNIAKRIGSFIKSCFKFIGEHTIGSLTLNIIGIVSTHTVLHIATLSAASIFVLNLLHMFFIVGLIITILAKINGHYLFNGKVKKMPAPVPSK